MRRALAPVALALAVLFGTGCAASCEDACSTVVDCMKRFDPAASDPTCVSDCESVGVCGAGVSEEKQQDALECMNGIACENETSATAEIVGCLLKCA